jgi:farnesyl-diphosphate farnesyltransferase
MSTPADDDRFCAAMLPRVSRTFAAGIAALPASLRAPTMIGYLVCRAADAIEDQTTLSIAERRVALRALRDEIIDAIAAATAPDAGVPSRLRRAIPASVGGGAWPAGLEGTSESDRELLAGRAHVLRALSRLPADVARIVGATAIEMCDGMSEYLQDDDTRPIRTWADLDRYCYFVAGTVGHMLTGLFLAGRAPWIHEAALVERATGFGTALQLVNVAKDAARDLEDGRCFLPSDSWPPGFSARKGDKPPAELHDVVAEVVARAWERVREAQEYLVSLPPDALPARRFCAMALHLAILTLRECERVPTLMDAERPPKVGRVDVATTVAWLALHAGDDRALAERYGALAGARA